MSTPPPAASVVVPSHRGTHRLPPLLDALAAQDCTDPWEVVVVLDGPDAEAEALLASWQDALPLLVVARPETGGVAVALNTGIAHASGRVIIRCDDDLTPAPDMVRRHLDHHRDAERVGVIGPTRDVLPDTPYAAAYGRSAAARALAAAYARAEDDRWVGWAAHNSVTRAALDEVGGFDASYSYREDSDLGLRLARAGVRIVVDPALELEHRGAATDTATRAARAWVSGASEVLFAQRHPDVAVPRARPSRPAERVWDVLTGVVGRALGSRDGARRLGALVDRALPRVGPRVGRRVVALVVEGAARSGRRRGSTEQQAYRAQKDEELTAERRRADGG